MLKALSCLHRWRARSADGSRSNPRLDRLTDVLCTGALIGREEASQGRRGGGGLYLESNGIANGIRALRCGVCQSPMPEAQGSIVNMTVTTRLGGEPHYVRM